jgi:hypothetical protein
MIWKKLSPHRWITSAMMVVPVMVVPVMAMPAVVMPVMVVPVMMMPAHLHRLHLVDFVLGNDSRLDADRRRRNRCMGWR